jgi:hypothetical protein
MAEHNLQRQASGLTVSSEIFLTASQRTLGREINLTALNAKSDPSPELIAEFDRLFGKESPEALEWAFKAWRDQSPFFPPICEIRKLVREFQHGEREQRQLRAQMDERFLLEEARKRGELLEFGEVVQQLKDFVSKMPEPEHAKREKRFQQKMASVTQIVPSLNLSADQIATRRDKERAECEQYRSHADNEFEL